MQKKTFLWNAFVCVLFRAIDEVSCFVVPTTTTTTTTTIIKTATTSTTGFGIVDPWLVRNRRGLGATREPVDLADVPDAVCFTIRSGAPLGIILSEFRSSSVPEFTPLVVQDVTELSNGAMRGVRVGDILLGVNGLSAIAEGVGFPQVMETLREGFDSNDGSGSGSGEVTIRFFRGSVNGGEEGFDRFLDVLVNGNEPSDDDDDDDDDVWGVEDENYVPPNLADFVDETEEKEVSVGELFGALFKETAKAVQQGLAPEETSEPKKKHGGGGLFGMFAQETIQMDENPNQFANPVDDKARKDD